MADTAVKGPLAFTASNGTTIETYDSHFVLINGFTGVMGITSNKLTFLFGDSTTDYIYRDGTGTYTADQYSSGTISGMGASGSSIFFPVRVSADTGANRDYYMLQVFDGGPQLGVVKKVVNGTETTLDSRNVTWTNGDVVKLRAIDNGANVDLVVIRNGTTLYTITDTSSVISSGKPGIGLKMGSANISQVDDVELGTVSSTPSTTVGADATYYNSFARNF